MCGFQCQCWSFLLATAPSLVLAAMSAGPELGTRSSAFTVPLTLQRQIMGLNNPEPPRVSERPNMRPTAKEIPAPHHHSPPACPHVHYSSYHRRQDSNNRTRVVTYTPWRRKSGMLIRKETTMYATHQKHRNQRRNTTSAPGVMMSSPYPISAESAGRLVMERYRLWLAYWFWGQAQKWLLSVFPVMIMFLIWLVVAHEQFRETAPIMAFCIGWGLVVMQRHQRGIRNEIQDLDSTLGF